ncbi:MAG: hypothetical protein AB2552_18045 [Candidatus Thiodiazotropha endolucinida]
MTMEEIVSRLAQEEDKRSAKRIVDAQINIISAAYDKAIAYTNLITIAGYASFFGLWQITQDKMSDSYSVWAALLLAVSASLFVLFEVTKTYFHSKNVLKLNEIISNPEISNSATALQAAFDEHNKKLNQQTVYWGYWWHFTWVITVSTGVTAIVLLLWSFVTHLIKP